SSGELTMSNKMLVFPGTPAATLPIELEGSYGHSVVSAFGSDRPGRMAVLLACSQEYRPSAPFQGTAVDYRGAISDHPRVAVAETSRAASLDGSHGGRCRIGHRPGSARSTPHQARANTYGPLLHTERAYRY